jgi:hypothetical protein
MFASIISHFLDGIPAPRKPLRPKPALGWRIPL